MDNIKLQLNIKPDVVNVNHHIYTKEAIDNMIENSKGKEVPLVKYDAEAKDIRGVVKNFRYDNGSCVADINIFDKNSSDLLKKIMGDLPPPKIGLCMRVDGKDIFPMENGTEVITKCDILSADIMYDEP